MGMQAAIKKYMFKDEKGMAEALAEAQEEFMRLSPARSRVSLLTVWYDPLRKSEPWVPLVHDQDFGALQHLAADDEFLQVPA